mgnify:CR=1 FL=1
MPSPAETHEVVYLHLPPGSSLPDWTYRTPFNAVVVATCTVSDDWQDRVSDWLVTSGIDDIGAPGADAIFGRGLLRAPKSCGAPEGDLFSSLSSSAPGDETASG